MTVAMQPTPHQSLRDSFSSRRSLGDTPIDHTTLNETNERRVSETFSEIVTSNPADACPYRLVEKYMGGSKPPPYAQDLNNRFIGRFVNRPYEVDRKYVLLVGCCLVLKYYMQLLFYRISIFSFLRKYVNAPRDTMLSNAFPMPNNKAIPVSEGDQIPAEYRTNAIP